MDMSGMGHGHSGSGASKECSMHMLGNWETLNVCVLTSSWHVKTQAQFAGTCIGVFLIVFGIETVRRWGREFDKYILDRAAEQKLERQSEEKRPLSGFDHIFFGSKTASSATIRPQFWQQLIRSLIYGVQFTGAYLVMLMAMTYNGYILLAIILGGMFGHFFLTWDTLGSAQVMEVKDLDPGYNSSSGNGMQHKLKTESEDSDSVESGKRAPRQRITALPDSYSHSPGACCV